LRVIREILFFAPRRQGTNLPEAIDFLNRVTSHRAIVVVLSDFLENDRPRLSRLLPAPANKSIQNCLRRAHRRHDVVGVQITDPHEMTLPNLGRLVLEDAETGELVELNTGNAQVRNGFASRREAAQAELERQFRSARIDTIRVQTHAPYEAALGRFFKTREKRRRRG
jgi:hypothetical protein